MSDFLIALRRRGRALFLLSGAIALGVAALLFAMRHRDDTAPQPATPELALRSLAAHSLYFNGAARPWLLKQRPDLLTAEDRDDKSERSRGLVQAVENPKLFRQLDRKYHFDALLFIGDPSQYRKLLDHLLEAKDWTLCHLDHASLVFRRDVSSEWQTSSLDAMAAQFQRTPDRAAFFAGAAVRLLAVRRGADAKAYLDKARALDDRLPEVWNGSAVYRMNRGEWTQALSDANRALAIDPNFFPALATKTQVLFSTKKFSQAYDFSARLIEACPDEPALLFYHAQICHEAHAFADEIRTLRRLVDRAESESMPASGYRLYLAQAYAREGKAQPAIEEFNRVLADADLSKEQRTFAEETLAQIKERSGAH